MSIKTLKQKNRAVDILLVEDNYGDALLVKKAFEKANLNINVTLAEDGEKAIAMLTKSGEYSETPTPDLVLLDINLPKLNGKEVLSKIKEQDALKHIPVIVLTSSVAEMDVIRSYQLGLNAYLVKPTDLTKLTDIVKGIEAFWFNLVVLPDNNDITDSNAS